MTLLTMYDACDPAHIPHGSQVVAGYIDPGGCQWPLGALVDAHWAPRTLIRITRDPAWDADVLDVENGAATPADIAKWASRQRHPTVYCSASNWLTCKRAAGHTKVAWWLAAWDGIDDVHPGAIGHQYEKRVGYDVSVVEESWVIEHRAATHTTGSFDFRGTVSGSMTQK
jgi:hypothetical protein